MAKSRKEKRLPVLGETVPFKPSHKIVSEKGELGIEGIGVKIPCGSASKGKIVFQDPNDPFQAGPILVEKVKTPYGVSERFVMITK